MIVLLMALFKVVVGPFNEPWDFLIGDKARPYGAVLLQDETSHLDLEKDCGHAFCPSVLIFNSQQWGTISVSNCLVGRKYLFVNKSRVDLGIVIQQQGGRFGSKAIGRYDVASCFCLEQDIQSTEEGSEDGNGTESEKGVLLCR